MVKNMIIFFFGKIDREVHAEENETQQQQHDSRIDDFQI